MTTTGTPHSVAVRASRTPVGPADVLVVGGCVVAPLNLLLVRSLTVYDVLLGVAFVLLVRDRRLRMPTRGYLTAAFVFLLAAALSSFRATYAAEALTQILQYAFIFLVQIPVVLSVVRTRGAAITSVALVCAGSVGAILLASLTYDTQGAGRVLVFYSENPNRLGYPAAYLAPLLLVLWQISREWQPVWRTATAVLLLGSGYLSVWAVAASASRSSAVGTLAALVVFIVLRPGASAGQMATRPRSWQLARWSPSPANCPPPWRTASNAASLPGTSEASSGTGSTWPMQRSGRSWTSHTSAQVSTTSATSQRTTTSMQRPNSRTTCGCS